MTKDIGWYINNGKAALSKKLGRPASNRDLCSAIGASPNAIIYWLDGTIPSEGIMLKFAGLMPQWVSREEALLDRKAWLSAKEKTDPAVAAAWASIRAKVLTIALPLLFLLISISSAQASVGPEVRAASAVYYGKVRKFLRRIARGFFGTPAHA